MVPYLVLIAALCGGSVAGPIDTTTGDPNELAPSLRIVQSNDDGWAEANARAFFNRLTAAGHDVVLSAPALDRSGTGFFDFPPKSLPMTSGCEYKSCPPKSSATGYNASNPRLNYVNSFPVTSVRVGLQSIAPKLWNGRTADLVVSGVNVGYNIGLQVYGSGTDNVAMYAARHGVPALAFSGHHGERVAWNKPWPRHSTVYADVAHELTNTIVAAGKPFLPDGTWLNVNMPKTSPKCDSVEKFKFVLTKIDMSLQMGLSLFQNFGKPDVEVCGNKGNLPLEAWIAKKYEKQCVVTVSVGRAGLPGTAANAGKATQYVVAKKLNGILTCPKDLGRD